MLLAPLTTLRNQLGKRSTKENLMFNRKQFAALATAALGTAAFATNISVPALPVTALTLPSLATETPTTSLPYLAPNAASSVGGLTASSLSTALNEQPSDLLLGARAASGRTAVLKSTAYNSLSAQTDSTPHITATGTRTRPGVVALSRDMLRIFPYGTRVRITPLNGSHPYVNGRVFVVEDTMNARKTGQVDIWMPTRSQAMQWGIRNVRITAL